VKDKIRAFILLFLIILTYPVLAQNTYLKYLDEKYSEGKNIIECSDGNYIILGRKIFNYYDYTYVIKINPDGNIIWSRIYGGNTRLRMTSITQVFDNGYVLSGYTSYTDKQNEMSILKINNVGDSLWCKNFCLGTGYSIIETIDSGLVITGTKDEKEIYLLKLNMNGDSLWMRTFQHGKSDFGTSVIETSDKGLAILGSSIDNGPNDIILIKTDSTGYEQWNKLYKYNEYSVIPSSIVQTNTKGFLISGENQILQTAFPFLNSNIWIVNTNEYGDTIWTKTININNEEVHKCVQAKNNEFVLIGSIFDGEYIENIIFVKISYDGSIKWIKEIGNKEKYRFCANDILETQDNGFLMTGYSLYDAGWGDSENISKLIVVKTDSIGNVEGYTSVKEDDLDLPSDYLLYQNYPNPFNPTTKIRYNIPKDSDVKLNIYDLSGRLISNLVSQYMSGGKYTTEWNASEHISGIYIYRLEADDFNVSRKMILIK
jgi:hypothetical protein